MQWLKDNAYWLVPAVMSLMGTAATKLSKYPQSKPATVAGWILRFLQAQLVDRLSLQPHADSPAHLQLGPVGLNVPLMRSIPPGGQPWLKMGSNGVPPAAALALLVGFGALGCGHLTGKQVWNDIVDCSAPAITSELPNVLGQAEQALTGTQPNWESLLLLEAAKSIPVVICAVNKIVHDAANKTQPEAFAEPQNQSTITNGQKYLEARKSAVAPAK